MKILLALIFTIVSTYTLALEPININSATESELEALKGVGPVIATRIVKYREEHGAFSSIQELEKVKGLSSKWVASNQASLKSSEN